MPENKKISQLDAASALDGTEIVPVTQNGTTVKTTAQDIADLSAGPENAILSDTTGITGASQLTNGVAISQADFDDITPSASTFYYIV